MQLTNQEVRELILVAVDRYIFQHDRVSAGAANLSQEDEACKELVHILRMALPDPPKKKGKQKAKKKARKP